MVVLVALGNERYTAVPMSARLIEGILRGSPFHMVGDGFRVRNYFPNGNNLRQRISPFFLLDYNPPTELPPTEKLRGVGVHPHRGFETVTLAFAGTVAHHDSAGNSGVIGPGDVQWMTAGSGVLHKEYQEAAFAKRGGTFHMLQLWVNLPAAHKMDKPSYQGITRDRMARAPIKNGEVVVVAGEYQGAKGPALTHTPMTMLVVNLEAGGVFETSLPPHWNTGVLNMKGLLHLVGGEKAQPEDFILYANDHGEDIRITSEQEAAFVVLSGEPINEPIAHYGPFLMNTPAELQQAMEDFNAGKFGTLAD